MKTSNKDKVLIVGGGLVGSSTAVFLDHFGVSDISISSSANNQKYYQKLFGIDTIMGFSGFGGLGNFWHGVINASSIEVEDFDREQVLQVFKLIMGFRPLSEDLQKEIVPISAVQE